MFILGLTIARAVESKTTSSLFTFAPEFLCAPDEFILAVLFYLTNPADLAIVYIRDQGTVLQPGPVIDSFRTNRDGSRIWKTDPPFWIDRNWNIRTVVRRSGGTGIRNDSQEIYNPGEHYAARFWSEILLKSTNGYRVNSGTYFYRLIVNGRLSSVR